MRPINFIGATGKFTAPAQWQTERPLCDDLHVMTEDGVHYSVWRPSWRQRLGLLFGRCVVLGIMSREHPPVSIGISKATEVKPHD